MDILSQHRDKLVIGALAVIILTVCVFFFRRVSPPAPQIRPGQTLEDPLGNAPGGSATTR